MIKIVPCGHKVLVEPDKLEKVSDGGIVLVHHNERAHEAAQITGTIIAVGPDAWKAFRTMNGGSWVNGRPWAGVGDRVYYSKHSGHRVCPNNDEEEIYVLLNDEDINAIILEEEAHAA